MWTYIAVCVLCMVLPCHHETTYVENVTLTANLGIKNYKTDLRVSFVWLRREVGAEDKVSG